MIQNLPAFLKKIRIFIVPALLVLAATGWLVVDGMRMRNKQLSKYELPADHSARTMLEFMRKMEGSAQFVDGYLESSNTKSVCQAIQRSYEHLQRDLESLTDEEKHEADFLRLCFLGVSMMQGIQPDTNSEVETYLHSSKAFIISAKKFTSREQQFSQGAIQLFDRLGRAELQREFISWLLGQLDQRAEFSSEAAKETSQSIRKTLKRLEMMNEILELRSATLDGQRFDLKSLRGKVVLIEFWGTRCTPCIADFPALKRIYATYKNRGFEIVSVCLNAAPARIESFAAKHQLPWIQLCHDKSASNECNNELSERFGVQYVPTTLLLDINGRVAAMSVRPLSGDPDHDLERWLAKLIAK